MEHKYLNNPEIFNFLSQYDKKEWDTIIEDLLLCSINKINEIEKAEASKNIAEIPIKKDNIPINNNSGIIFFNSNNNNCGPYECATNYLKKTAEYKSNSDVKTKTLKKLDELNKQINNIHSGDKKNFKNKKY